MIIASDGIWEFLSSKKVIDLIVPWVEHFDHSKASEIITTEAYNHWIEVKLL